MGTQIHSIKHIIDSEGALSGTLGSVNVLANAVVTRNSTFNPVEVEVGETINAMFISVFAIGATGAGQDGSINWYIAKARSGQDPSSEFPVASAVGVSPLRSQVFHQEKGLAGSADGTPMAFKGVIAIPRGMRRMREGDQIFIIIQSTDGVNDVNFCIRSIYKSFS